MLCFSSIVCAGHRELRGPDLVLVSRLCVHGAVELDRMLICRGVKEYRFPFCIASSSMTDDTGKKLHCMRSPDVAPAQTMRVKGCHTFWDAEQGRG